MVEGEELRALPTSGSGVLMLGRRELQRLAKKHGVKANLSSDAIVDQLLALRAQAMRHGAPSPGAPDETGCAAPERELQPGVALAGAVGGAVVAVDSRTTGPAETSVISSASRPAGGTQGAHAGPPRSPAAAQAPRRVDAVRACDVHVVAGASSVPHLLLDADPVQPQPQARLDGVCRTPERSLPPDTRADAASPAGVGTIARRASASPFPFARKRSGGAADALSAHPTGTPSGAAAALSSLAKRKSPGFMAPLRRHSSMESGVLKRHSTGVLRTPGRAHAEPDERERAGSKENEQPQPAGVDPALAKNILQEIVLPREGVSWDDIGARHGRTRERSARERVVARAPRQGACVRARAAPRVVSHARPAPSSFPFPLPDLRAQPGWKRPRPRCARS